MFSTAANTIITNTTNAKQDRNTAATTKHSTISMNLRGDGIVMFK